MCIKNIRGCCRNGTGMGWGTPCVSSRFQQKMGHCKGVGCNRSGAFWVWEYHCCPEWSFGYELPGRESSENWTWNICAIVSLRFGWFAASSSLIVATLSLSLSLSVSLRLSGESFVFELPKIFCKRGNERLSWSVLTLIWSDHVFEFASFCLFIITVFVFFQCLFCFVPFLE